MVSVGETLGCAIDLTSNKISYYKDGVLVGEFHNIKSKTEAPFYPAVSLESSGAFDWSISASSIKHVPSGYRPLSEAASNYTIFRERVDSTLSPIHDTVDFFNESIEKLSKNFGPIADPSIDTSAVRHLLNHFMAKTHPGRSVNNDDEKRHFFIEFFQDTIHKNTLALYAVHFEQTQARWNDPVLDPSKYPTLAAIRPRSKEQTDLETDMKRFLLVSSIPPDNIETGSVWDYLLLKFEENQDVEATRKGLVALSKNNPVPLSERTKIDIESFSKIRSKLIGHDSERLISELICVIDIPFNDFMQFPECKGPQIGAYLIGYMKKVEQEYESLKTDCLHRPLPESDRKTLATGKDAEKRKILEDPANLALCLFWGGDMRTKAKKLLEFYSVSAPVPSQPQPKVVKLPLQEPQPSTITTNTIKPEPKPNPTPNRRTTQNSQPNNHNNKILGIPYQYWMWGIGILGTGIGLLYLLRKKQ